MLLLVQILKIIVIARAILKTDKKPKTHLQRLRSNATKTYLKDLTPEEVIRRLKAGEVVKNEQSKNIIKYIDDVLCNFCENGTVEYNTNFWICNCNYYFETPDELKLEVGKCYKTRDGEKAFISVVSENDFAHGIMENDTILRSWHKNGVYMRHKKNSLDLISEWSDDDVEKD